MGRLEWAKKNEENTRGEKKYQDQSEQTMSKVYGDLISNTFREARG